MKRLGGCFLVVAQLLLDEFVLYLLQSLALGLGQVEKGIGHNETGEAGVEKIHVRLPDGIDQRLVRFKIQEGEESTNGACQTSRVVLNVGGEKLAQKNCRNAHQTQEHENLVKDERRNQEPFVVAWVAHVLQVVEVNAHATQRGRCAHARYYHQHASVMTMIDSKIVSLLRLEQ